jgi:hypothetical protein
MTKAKSQEKLAREIIQGEGFSERQAKQIIAHKERVVCPYYQMLKTCVWRADVKCYAGPCVRMSENKLANR